MFRTMLSPSHIRDMRKLDLETLPPSMKCQYRQLQRKLFTSRKSPSSLFEQFPTSKPTEAPQKDAKKMRTSCLHILTEALNLSDPSDSQCGEA
eukprot:Nitzschia sp. Nitz4//scaffold308_size21609//15796//16074//NITZ4_008605-RA/size21609-processed-gene-0.8-mRNA-1//-1//CDS//3329547161//4557//frame0